ncbi:MAG: UDP-N-acetylmuramate dehydrogenase [Pirellulales bacterium]|nr:UDP-N-acetylmuramate dehydrogenase [Pirellulales bacterium]
MASFSGFEEILKTNEPLAPHTWFGLGGPAQFFAKPRSLDQLQALVVRAHDEGLAVRLLGGGSNLLVRPEGVSGLVIHLADPTFARIEVKRTEVIAGAGAKLGHVISTSIREGLGGLEALVGIPGTIGGALHGNAGSRGGDIGQWTCHATVLSAAGRVIERKREDMVFAYRDSSLDELVIVEARFQLEQDDPVELTKRMQKQWIQKKAAQPLGHQSAGCIFKNPRGMSAGMLIDQAGLKGARVGGAEVSTRHANFIVADPGCTTNDVLQLIEKVRAQVAARLGVDLELEIEIW